MKTIWKTTVGIADYAFISLPTGAHALSCRASDQDGMIDIWWLVYTNAPKINTLITIAGTGHPLDDRIAGMGFIGTTVHGTLRFHVFAP